MVRRNVSAQIYLRSKLLRALLAAVGLPLLFMSILDVSLQIVEGRESFSAMPFIAQERFLVELSLPHLQFHFAFMYSQAVRILVRSVAQSARVSVSECIVLG